MRTPLKRTFLPQDHHGALYGHGVAQPTIVGRYVKGMLHATGSARGGSGIQAYVYVWPVRRPRIYLFAGCDGLMSTLIMYEERDWTVFDRFLLLEARGLTLWQKSCKYQDLEERYLERRSA